MSNEEMKRAMEAILFAAGESVEITRIAQSLDITPKKAESLLEELKEELKHSTGQKKVRIIRRLEVVESFRKSWL